MAARLASQRRALVGKQDGSNRDTGSQTQRPPMAQHLLLPHPSGAPCCSLSGGKEEGSRLVSKHRFQGAKCNQQEERSSTVVNSIAYTVSPKL